MSSRTLSLKSYQVLGKRYMQRQRCNHHHRLQLHDRHPLHHTERSPAGRAPIAVASPCRHLYLNCVVSFRYRAGFLRCGSRADDTAGNHPAPHLMPCSIMFRSRCTTPKRIPNANACSRLHDLCIVWFDIFTIGQYDAGNTVAWSNGMSSASLLSNNG